MKEQIKLADTLLGSAVEANSRLSWIQKTLLNFLPFREGIHYTAVFYVDDREELRLPLNYCSGRWWFVIDAKEGPLYAPFYAHFSYNLSVWQVHQILIATELEIVEDNEELIVIDSII